MTAWNKNDPCSAASGCSVPASCEDICLRQIRLPKIRVTSLSPAESTASNYARADRPFVTDQRKESDPLLYNRTICLSTDFMDCSVEIHDTRYIHSLDVVIKPMDTVGRFQLKDGIEKEYFKRVK